MFSNKPCTIRSMFIHLTAHSVFSLQEGLLQPEELAQAAQAHGMTAIGLTDHRLLTGSIEFVKACKGAGIQPILGLEVDLPNGKLALLATSTEGWSNLCRLSSALALRDEPEAVCTPEMLALYSGDLLALGAHQLEELKTIFQDRLYVALQEPSNASQLSSLARRLGLPTVVTHPVYYRLSKPLCSARCPPSA